MRADGAHFYVRATREGWRWAIRFTPDRLARPFLSSNGLVARNACGGPSFLSIDFAQTNFRLPAIGKKYTIYALLDPRDKTRVKYVGATSQNLNLRLAQHLSSRQSSDMAQWIAELKASGVCPIIVPLEECQGKETANQIEGKWIGNFRLTAINCHLPNYLPGGYTLNQKLILWRGDYTQKEAASVLGVNLSTYKNWEYGINSPSLLATKEIARVLETPLSSILPPTTKKKKPQQETFQERLLKWRGHRLQKEAAEALNVTLAAYRKWEYGKRTPKKITLAEIDRRMASNPDTTKA